jgi:hypothetical protein
MEISSPINHGWLERLRSSFGDGQACGFVKFCAGLEPDRIEDEFDSEILEVEPVQACLSVSPDAFEAIHRQVIDAIAQCRILMATLTLSIDDFSDPKETLIGLEDLDVSKTQKHLIKDFDIDDIPYFERLRSRGLYVKTGQDKKSYGATISVLLTEAHYELDAVGGYVNDIRCQGRVIAIIDEPFFGAWASITFREFETNKRDELPKNSFYGNFTNEPNEPDEKRSSRSIYFELMYMPQDGLDLLIPLFRHENHTDVVLKINLTNKKEDLLAAKGSIEGNVWSYSFEVERKFNYNEK